MTVTITEYDELRQRFQDELPKRVPVHIQRLAWSKERIVAHQRDALRALLRQAITHSPFHARRLAAVDVERFELADLPSLPVMTKADMMAAFDEVVTDRRIDRAAVEAHLAATGDLPSLLAGEYLCTTSGGSSGLRGVYIYNWDAVVDFNLAVVAPAMARFMAPGGAVPPGGIGVAAVAAPNAIHMTRAGSAFADGAMTRIINAPATLPLAEIVSRLNQGRPQLLMGYTSAVRLLAAEQQAGRLSLDLLSISTTSEQLTVETAEAIRSAFGVPVTNTFGSSEGLVGASVPGEEAIAFRSDLAVVELVDEDNRPVADGTPSAKVLVTNLYNRAQPLIRYEMEDRFVRQPDAADHGHLRATVAGRSDDVLVYGDVRIHPLVLRAKLLKTAVVLEYQVRQTPRGVDVDVVTSAPIDEARLAADLRRALEQAGLSDAEATVRSVASLERHPQTGKVRRFLPLA